MTTVLVRHDLPVGAELKAEGGDFAVRSADDVDTTHKFLPEADALVVNNETWDDSFLTGLDEGDWVQTTSMGYEALPLETFRERGIRFSNAADNYTTTVAEHALALMLGLARNLSGFLEGKRNRRWVQDLGAELTDISGKTLTIVGLGNIGEAIATRCRPFGMTIQGIKRTPAAYEGILPEDQVHPPEDLETLVAETDFLVLSVPLTPETRNMIDRAALATMPSDAYLINVARGGVVDQDALTDALASGSIAGAAVDVYTEEPLPTDSPLWTLENVITTPHIAGRSESFIQRFVDLFLANVDRFQKGMELRNQIV